MKTKCTLFILLFLAVKSFSQPGSLDVSFANEGRLLSTTSTGLPNYARSVICKKDGSLLVGSGEANTFIVKQFLNNGNADSTFGNKGETKSIFNTHTYAYTSSIAITDDGKIVAAGVGEGGAGSHNADILLARYFENGTIDSSFGNNGAVTSDFGLIELISSMKITKEGNILVAGYCQADDESKSNFFLAQYKADGSTDMNFGNKGKVVTDIGASYSSEINSIAITQDGSLIAAGTGEYIQDFQQNKVVTAKYSKTGKLLTDYGTKGLAFTSITDNENSGLAVALQGDEKIVVAGYASTGFLGPYSMSMIRLNADGSLDKSFNQSGGLVISFNTYNSSAYALLIEPNGNFLLGGIKNPRRSSGPVDYSAIDFALAAVTKDGSIDSSFGTNGLVTTDFSQLSDQCYALALQPDGKIIAAGGSSDTSRTNPKTYITLARYTNEISKRQIVAARIRRWLQHHNGIMWTDVNGAGTYVVQRSADGVGFSPVAKISAGGAGNITYADPMPLQGTNYYRVQTMGVNSRVAYSNVVAITSTGTAVTVSPNPATSYLHIEGLSAHTKLTLVDFSGNARLETTTNTPSCNLNIATLTKGSYVVKIEANGEVITKQVMKE